MTCLPKPEHSQFLNIESCPVYDGGDVQVVMQRQIHFTLARIEKWQWISCASPMEQKKSKAVRGY